MGMTMHAGSALIEGHHREKTEVLSSYSLLLEFAQSLMLRVVAVCHVASLPASIHF